jgi:hypothetical protein
MSRIFHLPLKPSLCHNFVFSMKLCLAVLGGYGTGAICGYCVKLSAAGNICYRRTAQNNKQRGGGKRKYQMREATAEAYKSPTLKEIKGRAGLKARVQPPDAEPAEKA